MRPHHSVLSCLLPIVLLSQMALAQEQADPATQSKQQVVHSIVDVDAIMDEIQSELELSESDLSEVRDALSQMVDSVASGKSNQESVESFRKQLLERLAQRQVDQVGSVTSQIMERRLLQAVNSRQLTDRESNDDHHAETTTGKDSDPSTDHAGGPENDENHADPLESQLQQLRQHLDECSEEWGDDVEQAVGAWSAQLTKSWESWANEHAGEWSTFSDMLEQRMDQLSELQGDQMELTPDQVQALLIQNADLLNDLPINPLIDQVSKTIDSLKDFPWQALTSHREEFKSLATEIKQVLNQTRDEYQKNLATPSSQAEANDESNDQPESTQSARAQTETPPATPDVDNDVAKQLSDQLIKLEDSVDKQQQTLDAILERFEKIEAKLQ